MLHPIRCSRAPYDVTTIRLHFSANPLAFGPYCGDSSVTIGCVHISLTLLAIASIAGSLSRFVCLLFKMMLDTACTILGVIPLDSAT